MQIYLLHLRGPGRFQQAANRVLDCDRIASCTLEPRQLRLRFLASERVAARLLEEIYQDGGLTWCSRHAFAADGRRQRASP